MPFEIEFCNETQSIKIINENGDFIDIDFPNINCFKQIEKFLQQSAL